MKISACIITRDEPLLAQAVRSVRPFVDEVVIVDTGSVNPSDSHALADRFELFTDCNDKNGFIANFALARQRSFDLASHETVLWLDADDEVCGLDGVREQLTSSPTRYIAPYEYLYNPEGDCIVRHWRERIITGRQHFVWDRWVHEGIIGRKGAPVTPDVRLVGPVWKHRRPHGWPSDRERNMRILKQMAKHERDTLGFVEPRTLHDLGNECYLRGSHSEALNYLHHYVAASGWDAERFQAYLKIVDIHSFYGNWDRAYTAAQEAVSTCPNDPCGYFALAKLEHQRASGDREVRSLRMALFYGQKGLDMSDLPTSLVTNPSDRAFAIPELMADAAKRLGEKGVLVGMLDLCLRTRKGDPGLLLQKRENEPPTGGLDIVFACGLTQEQWNPQTIAAKGIGGSETAVVEVARRLAKLGHRVRVYCSNDTDGLFDDVEYRDISKLSDVKKCDVLVAWRNAAMLGFLSAKVKWLWVHDTSIGDNTPWNIHYADRVLALSKWHGKHLASEESIPSDKISITSNGIDLARFASKPERNTHRVLYTSSPDRGLEQLLLAWPKVRAVVPDAELRIFYGWGGLRSHAADSEIGLWLARVDKLLEDLAPHGVSHHGRVDQKTLAHEMLCAGAWVHPSTMPGGNPFTETSCIGAMEAQAAGCIVVYRPEGALEETVRDGIPTSIENLPDALTDALTEDEHINCRAGIVESAANLSWDRIVDQWLSWAAEDMAKPNAVVWSSSGKRTVHAILAPHISGQKAIDPHNTHLNPATGGCLAGFLGLVKAMGLRGDYQVRAFATFKDRFTVKDGVEYFRIDELPSAPKPDALLAYYDTSPLIGQTGMLRIASHHTYSPYMNFEWADVNTAPSEHSARHLRDRHDPHSAWYVLPNGVELSVVRRPVPGRVIYHTSPDRGLGVLLASWPDIRKRVPHATLHVTGDVEAFASSTFVDLRSRECSEAVARGLKAAKEAGGVKLLGKIPRAELDNELAEASVFAFPCKLIAPCETFSVSVMECLNIGLPVVMVPADALRSIYEGSVVMTDFANFTDRVCETLESPNDSIVLNGIRLASQFTFEKEAEVLSQILAEQLPRFNHIGA